MGSEQGWNKTDDPALCANGCGFFGSAATRNLCSKCFRDSQVADEQSASAKAAVEKSFNPPPQAPHLVVVDDRKARPAVALVVSPGPSRPSEEKGGGGTGGDGVAVAEAAAAGRQPPTAPAPGRCGSCKKRVGLTGFACRCGRTFCGAHRYPEKHECSYDFKGAGREAIAKANPVVKAEKVRKI